MESENEVEEDLIIDGYGPWTHLRSTLREELNAILAREKFGDAGEM